MFFGNYKGYISVTFNKLIFKMCLKLFPTRFQCNSSRYSVLRKLWAKDIPKYQWILKFKRQLISVGYWMWCNYWSVTSINNNRYSGCWMNLHSNWCQKEAIDFREGQCRSRPGGLFQICELAQLPLHKKTGQFFSATGLRGILGKSYWSSPTGVVRFTLAALSEAIQ